MIYSTRPWLHGFYGQAYLSSESTQKMKEYKKY